MEAVRVRVLSYSERMGRMCLRVAAAAEVAGGDSIGEQVYIILYSIIV